jgi:squalene-hopene/tetraprenyl-beta-curcumene cyclase
MHRFRLLVLTASSLVAFALASAAISAGPQAQTSAPRSQSAPAARGAAATAPVLSAETRTRLMASLEKGAAYLKKNQAADGRWEEHPGITAMAAAVLLKQPGVTHAAALQAVGKSLDVLAKLAKADGGIYQKDIPHYITAVSVMALVAGGRPTDKPIIEKARAYLVEHLLDEGEGVQPGDKFYGGMGYGGTSDGGKADMISLEYGLRAMKEADLPANSTAWDKAIKFIQRSQNNSETNDQKWAANDGGFIYYPGYSQVPDSTRSYGAASYAGILSYTWANVKKTDPRVQAVLKWVKDNYTVEENPGLGQHTVYYYYMVFAKALQAVGDPVIVDAKGVRHNWREDLAKKLISLQNAEGYWVNAKDPGEMQDNKVLVTCFTMEAIESILK